MGKKIKKSLYDIKMDDLDDSRSENKITKLEILSWALISILVILLLATFTLIIYVSRG
jgi:hypothetical protein